MSPKNPNKVPTGTQNNHEGSPRSPKGVKGIQKGGTKQTKVSPKPPFEPQGIPTRFQREPKMVTRGTQGTQREHRGSKAPQGKIRPLTEGPR